MADVRLHGMCGEVVAKDEEEATVTLRIHSKDVASVEHGMWFVCTITPPKPVTAKKGRSQ